MSDGALNTVENRPPVFLGAGSRLRPLLGVVLPNFPYSVEAGKVARSVNWWLYGVPLAVPYVLLWQALIVVVNWFILWPVVSTAVVWSWAVVSFLGMRVLLVLAGVTPFGVAAYFLLRKHDPQPWFWLASAVFWVAAYAHTLWRLNVVGVGLMVALGLFLTAADQALVLTQDRWYMRRRAASSRRRHPMVWQLTANKTTKVQSGAVGGGESGGPIENVGGGRLELDHPAMGLRPSFDLSNWSVTWRVGAPTGRDLTAVQEVIDKYVAQDGTLYAGEVTIPHDGATWGKLTLIYYPRPDPRKMWQQRPSARGFVFGKVGAGDR